MTAQIIALAIVVLVMLIPAALIGYITVGGLWKEHRAKARARVTVARHAHAAA